jgi:hypothetical protein
MFDFSKVERLKSKADSGDVNAQIELGKEYLSGKNVQANFNKGFAYFSMAARKNSSEAMYLMGECHENGTGTPVNSSSAYQSYAKAAKMGHLRATLALAHYYETGKAGIVDYPKALEQFKAALQLGHNPAKEQIARLESLCKSSLAHANSAQLAAAPVGTRGAHPAQQLLNANATGRSGAGAQIKIDDVPFFKGLGAMELLFLMGFVQNIKGKRGQFLFCEGQPPNGLFIVLSGQCSVRLTNVNSNTITEIKSVTPGEYVGEFGLIDGLPRSATVIVTEDTELMFLPNKAFHSAIETQPKVAEVVTKNLLTAIRDKNLIIREKEAKDLVYSGRPVPSDMDTMRKLVAILRASNSTEQTDYWDR